MVCPWMNPSQNTEIVFLSWYFLGSWKLSQKYPHVCKFMCTHHCRRPSESRRYCQIISIVIQMTAEYYKVVNGTSLLISTGRKKPSIWLWPSLRVFQILVLLFSQTSSYFNMNLENNYQYCQNDASYLPPEKSHT